MHNNKRVSKIERSKRKKDLRLFASKLEKHLPKSEVWFRNKFEKESLGYNKNPRLVFNKDFKYYIPDVISYTYRFVIEIDGSIHKLPSQKIKDYRKNNFYIKRNFKVFRIEAFNNEDYELKINLLKDYIKQVKHLDKIYTTDIKLSNDSKIY